MQRIDLVALVNRITGPPAKKLRFHLSFWEKLLLKYLNRLPFILPLPTPHAIAKALGQTNLLSPESLANKSKINSPNICAHYVHAITPIYLLCF